MKKLYHFSLSPFCRKIRLIIGEKKLNVELIEEKFWEKRVQFIKINHAGEVPVYLENHLTLSDSNAIFEYLEENEIIGSNHYVGNETTLKFNNSNSLAFKTRSNREIDMTEFYNLMYQLKANNHN